MEPISDAFWKRLVIIGNSGSGKSTLAERIAHQTLQPVFDLDLFHWHEDGRKRDEHAARGMTITIAADAAWIMEGVYGWLVEEITQRATALIWLDLPWSECRSAIAKRGLRRGMSQRDLDALVTWAEAYWSRRTPSSAWGHYRIFDRFDGCKLRLTSRTAVEEFVAAVDAANALPCRST